MSANRSVSLLAGLNVAAAVASAATSALTAFLFGTSRAVEVYFAAATLYMMTVSLTQTGAVMDVFLPIYYRLKETRDALSAKAAFAVLLNWMVLLAGAAVAALWLAAPAVIALLVPGFGDADQAQGVLYFRAVLPLVLLRVVAIQFLGLCNAERWYGLPESMTPLSQIASMVVLVAAAPAIGVWALVASLWTSQTLQLLAFIAVTYRFGYRHALRWSHPDFAFGEVMRQVGSTYLYFGGTQVYKFALSAAVSILPQGIYAVYNYVQTLNGKLQGTILRPVGVVFLTDASESVAKGGGRIQPGVVRAALLRATAMVSLVVALFAGGGRYALDVIWGHGKFSETDLELAFVLTLFFLGLLYVTAMGLIARKLVAAMGRLGLLYLLMAAAQLVSALAAWWLIGRFGFEGLLATLVVNAVATAGAALLLGRRLTGWWAGYTWRDALRWGGATAVAATPFLLLPVFETPSVLLEVLYGGALGAAAVALFGVMAVLTGLVPAQTLLSWRPRRSA